MPSITDPARELSDLIRGMAIDPNVRMDRGLATLFDVPAWSSDFYQIIFSISSRIDELINLTDDLALDDDYKIEIKDSLGEIQTAFGPSGLNNNFSHSRQLYLSAANVSPLSALSGLVRQMRAYPRLDADEQQELVTLVDELISWLEDHQLSEQDFIRQALVEGLERMAFRLERIKWFGWGYTLESLREVISAYFALERATPQDGSNPPAEAMIKFVSQFVSNFLSKAGLAKDAYETGDFMLKAYGAIQLLLAGKSTIAGLLTHG